MSDRRVIGGRRWCRAATLLLALTVAACSGRRASSGVGARVAVAPAALLGDFTDDYRGTYQISDSLWRHGTRMAYKIVAWHVDSQYLIARNAATNPSAPGLWTRIDWMLLSDMAPYTWAYCLSAYEAPTRAAAEGARTADRRTPRTGCNGFPFSRMQRRTSSP